jgi:prepilin-type processing-associated H-X9-DG protein
MYPYIKTGSIWACPVAVRDGARDHTFDGTPGDTTVSLGYNGSALAPNRIGLLLDSAKHPEDTVAFVDTTYYLATPASLAPALRGSPPTYRHRDQANVAYLDGHVKGLTKDVLEATAEVESDQPLASGIDRFLHWNLK